MKDLLLVFFGGGTGAVARYGLTHVVKHHSEGSNFPWHTLSVNILGAFLIGLLVEVLALRANLAEPGRLLLVTGFLGGFTTFSAFALENALMLEKGDYTGLIAYILASVLGTLIAVFAGTGLVRSLV